MNLSTRHRFRIRFSIRHGQYDLNLENAMKMLIASALLSVVVVNPAFANRAKEPKAKTESLGRIERREVRDQNSQVGKRAGEAREGVTEKPIQSQLAEKLNETIKELGLSDKAKIDPTLARGLEQAAKDPEYAQTMKVMTKVLGGIKNTSKRQAYTLMFAARAKLMAAVGEAQMTPAFAKQMKHLLVYGGDAVARSSKSENREVYGKVCDAIFTRWEADGRKSLEASTAIALADLATNNRIRVNLDNVEKICQKI